MVEFKFCPWCGGEIAGMKIPPRGMTPRDHMLRIAGAHKVSEARLCGRAKTKDLVDARRAVARYLYFEHEDRPSLAEIGKLLGGRHHATILNLIAAKKPRTDKRSGMNRG